jgi:hypothetical protein
MLPTPGISALLCSLVLGGLDPLGPPSPAGAQEQSHPVVPTAGVVLVSRDLVAGAGTVTPTAASVMAEAAQFSGPSKPPAVSTLTRELERTGAGLAADFLTALQGTSGASPPFVYAPGFFGVGYYRVPGTQPAPAVASNATTSRATASRTGSAPRRYREFGSGRSVRLEKPWLRQFG